MTASRPFAGKGAADMVLAKARRLRGLSFERRRWQSPPYLRHVIQSLSLRASGQLSLSVFSRHLPPGAATRHLERVTRNTYVVTRSRPYPLHPLPTGQLVLPLSVQPSLWASEPLVSHVPLPPCPLAP